MFSDAFLLVTVAEEVIEEEPGAVEDDPTSDESDFEESA